MSGLDGELLGDETAPFFVARSLVRIVDGSCKRVLFVDGSCRRVLIVDGNCRLVLIVDGSW
jgi:hypothetical protein